MFSPHRSVPKKKPQETSIVSHAHFDDNATQPRQQSAVRAHIKTVAPACANTVSLRLWSSQHPKEEKLKFIPFVKRSREI